MRGPWCCGPLSAGQPGYPHAQLVPAQHAPPCEPTSRTILPCAGRILGYKERNVHHHIEVRRLPVLEG